MNATCEHCDHEYTYLIGTVVYSRCEDEEIVNVTISPLGQEPRYYKINNNASGNHSLRRSSCEIVFRCEACHRLSSIAFSDHKGIIDISQIKTDSSILSL